MLIRACSNIWPPDAKSWFIRKDPDAGKDWRQEKKGTTEDEMVGWHYRLNGHEFEQALGDSEGQGSLACCSPWGRKGSDTTGRLNKNKNAEIHSAHMKTTVMEMDLFVVPHLTIRGFTFSVKAGTGCSLSFLTAFLASRRWGHTNWGLQVFWGQHPKWSADSRSLVLGRGGGNPLAPNRQTNMHPNKTTRKALLRKFSTCKHVFVTAKGLGFGVFGP